MNDPLNLAAHVAQSWLQQVVIRRLEYRDLPALEWNGEYAHFRRLFAGAYQRSLEGKSVLWVAEISEEHLGQLFVELECDRSELADGRQRAYQYSFRIKPAYRGAGLGTRMLYTAEEDLRRKGFNQITLMVAQENLQAQRLYQSLGYRVVACESGCWWYPDQDEVWQQVHEPGWRMEKLL